MRFTANEMGEHACTFASEEPDRIAHETADQRYDRQPLGNMRWNSQPVPPRRN